MHRLTFAAVLSLFLAGLAVAAPARAAELRVSREALQRTLENQLFTGPNGRFYLKGSPVTACSVYVEKPQITFTGDRIVVQVKTHAHIGTPVHGLCLGLALSPTSAVSFTPEGLGEIIGFRDARIEHISDRRELNFLLTPFLSRDVPSSMSVNAADLLRKALAGSTATSGYKVTLDRLKIHSVMIDGDDLVVDVDGGLSVQ